MHYCRLLEERGWINISPFSPLHSNNIDNSKQSQNIIIITIISLNILQGFYTYKKNKSAITTVCSA